MTSGRARVMLRPSNPITPRVVLYRPVSMLKNVVLPAPFGPMIETIESGGISKETSLTATSPPNSLLTWVAKSSGARPSLGGAASEDAPAEASETLIWQGLLARSRQPRLPRPAPADGAVLATVLAGAAPSRAPTGSR